MICANVILRKQWVEDEKLALIDKFINENESQFEPGELHLIKKLKK